GPRGAARHRAPRGIAGCVRPRCAIPGSRCPRGRWLQRRVDRRVAVTFALGLPATRELPWGGGGVKIEPSSPQPRAEHPRERGVRLGDAPRPPVGPPPARGDRPATANGGLPLSRSAGGASARATTPTPPATGEWPPRSRP